MTSTKKPKILCIQKATLLGCFVLSDTSCQNEYFLCLFWLKIFSFHFIQFVNDCLSLLYTDNIGKIESKKHNKG